MCVIDRGKPPALHAPVKTTQKQKPKPGKEKDKRAEIFLRRMEELVIKIKSVLTTEAAAGAALCPVNPADIDDEALLRLHMSSGTGLFPSRVASEASAAVRPPSRTSSDASAAGSASAGHDFYADSWNAPRSPDKATIRQDAAKVAEWVRDLGVTQHPETFEEEGIDWVVLSDMTHTSLIELGVTREVARIKLLWAIAELGVPPPRAAATFRPSLSPRRNSSLEMLRFFGDDRPPWQADAVEDPRERKRKDPIAELVRPMVEILADQITAEIEATTTTPPGRVRIFSAQATRQMVLRHGDSGTWDQAIALSVESAITAQLEAKLCDLWKLPCYDVTFNIFSLDDEAIYEWVAPFHPPPKPTCDTLLIPCL